MKYETKYISFTFPHVAVSQASIIIEGRKAIEKEWGEDVYFWQDNLPDYLLIAIFAFEIFLVILFDYSIYLWDKKRAEKNGKKIRYFLKS